MIYSQIAQLPIIFQVEEGASTRIGEHLERSRLVFRRVAVFCGASFSRQIAENIAATMGYDVIEVRENSLSEVDRLRAEITRNRYDCFIGVGGGRVLDTVKLLAYLMRTNHIAVPTIISNDGLISPIAVIKDATGMAQSMAGQAPMGVVVDLDIILASPPQYLQAAAGDILSNLSATNDWLLAAGEIGEPVYDIAFQSARTAANSLIYCSRPEIDYKPFIRLLVQAQVNSGIAMSIAGTSRPCSGSEHLLSHALDFLGLGEHLHGLQVGSLSLLCLFLQKALKPEHRVYTERLNIPSILPALVRMSHGELGDLLKLAKTMRAGRRTVLDRYDSDTFPRGVEEFQQASVL